MGVIANNPHHLAGAIDSDAADEHHFIRLCDTFDIPILSLMDCPGMMVGPDVEATALVPHCVRMFNAGANLTAAIWCGSAQSVWAGRSSHVWRWRLGGLSRSWPTAELPV